MVISKDIFDREGPKRKPAYYHNPGSEPLRAITTGQLVDIAAEKWPTRNAIVSLHEGKSLTFKQLKEQSERLGAAFLKLGLRPGDRLAVLGVNTVHWYVTMMAAAKAGLILVMLNPAYRARELRGALTQVEVKGIVSDHRYKSQDYPQLLAELAPGMAAAPHGQPLRCPELPSLSSVIVATDHRLPGCYRYKDVMSLAESTKEISEVEELIQPDDPCCIQFSSGTTGQPKATVLSHFGTINNGHFFGKRAGYAEMHHTVCLQVPMFHIFGSTVGILCCMDYGNTILLPGPRFDKHSTIEALTKHKCNVMYGTPTMYADICSELKNALPNSPKLREALKDFQVVVTGGAICPPSLFEEMLSIFSCKLQSAYGLTETSPVCFTNPQNDTLEKMTTTVGHVLDHLEVKIVDTEGRMVNFGEPGEAWYRSYGNLLKYWNNEEKTKEAITTANWFKSGDVLVLSEDGYGKVVGRIKDIIIRGGENIFPSEIESFLLQHREILDAQVIGVKDERMGEEVAAYIKLTTTSTMTEVDLKEFCKGKIAHFKIPKYVRFVNEYPTTPSGKIKKYVLKEMLETELDGVH